MELGLATRKKVVEMERGDGCWEEGVWGGLETPRNVNRHRRGGRKLSSKNSPVNGVFVLILNTILLKYEHAFDGGFQATN